MKLWIIRHAKSSWADPGQSDFQRPLNKRGKRDGPVMATWLAAQSDPAQWIWTSDAARAAATAEFVRSGFSTPASQLIEAHELYLATADTLLETIRATPDTINSVAVVGHNPGITQFLNSLVNERVSDGVPTLGVARIHCPSPWCDLQFAQGTLELFESPKTIAGQHND